VTPEIQTIGGQETLAAPAPANGWIDIASSNPLKAAFARAD
jgi:hypothetical protein